MCDPVSLAVTSMVLSAGTAYLGFQGAQQQAADAQVAANVNFAQRKEASSAEFAQLDRQRSEDTLDREIESVRSSGRIAASINEMGLGGQTGTQLINTQAFESGRAGSIAELNFEQNREQVQRGVRGAEIERQSSLNAARKPSSLSLILGLGKAGLDGVNTYSSAGGKF